MTVILNTTSPQPKHIKKSETTASPLFFEPNLMRLEYSTQFDDFIRKNTTDTIEQQYLIQKPPKPYNSFLGIK